MAHLMRYLHSLNNFHINIWDIWEYYFYLHFTGKINESPLQNWMSMNTKWAYDTGKTSLFWFACLLYFTILLTTIAVIGCIWQIPRLKWRKREHFLYIYFPKTIGNTAEMQFTHSWEHGQSISEYEKLY